MLAAAALAALSLLAQAGCSSSASDSPRAEALGARRVKVDHPGLPLAGASTQELSRFKQGDALFEAIVRESDGLGPLYVRDACAACHAGDGRGPGLVTKAFVDAGASGLGQASALLPFGPTERPFTAAGAKLPLLLANVPGLRVTPRLPPAVFGRGYLEAIAESELERLARAAAQRGGAIRGRVNRLNNGKIGRFGVKARLATLADVSADALSSDMGISSPARPVEPAGPEMLADDRKPGVDFSSEQVALLADYVRLLELPARAPESARGRALFEQVECSTCHVPSLKTEAWFVVRALAGVEAPVFSDLLLHDMGEAMSDGQLEESAGPREFRTAPLLGLRFLPALLHDGRARNVEQAILAHGAHDSEARDSVATYQALPSAERAELRAFVEAL